MIKTVGFGKKRVDMSLYESQRYHIEKHAPFGKEVAVPLGMTRYVGYYPQEAFTLYGKKLATMPWDFVIPEYFTDEFFQNMGDWRENTEGGQAITVDEGEFCDRSNGYMMTCEDNILVPEQADSIDEYLIVLLNKSSVLTHEQCIDYHKQHHAPLVKKILGNKLIEYVTYYVDQVYGLEEGLLPERNYDMIVALRIAAPFSTANSDWKSLEGYSLLLNDLSQFIDLNSATVLRCEKHSYQV